ncbi:MAG: hypothetical protein K6E63_07480 [Lachnospiraceae bacterium]|nr:hypothetical protein [Lachnospiraceae bacterium]
MNKTIRRMMSIMLAFTLCMGILTGCGKKAEPVAVEPEEYYDDEEYYEDYEDYEDYEEYEEYEESEDTPAAAAANTGNLSNDEIVEMAKKYSGAPVAELDQVMDNGNLFIHLYKATGDHTETIDWYEIDPKTLKGTDFEGNTIDISEARLSDTEGDEGEGVSIADGEYVTDEEYKGELSSDGKTMTITTALYEFVNSPSPSYPEQTYVITVADSCKCVEMQEETYENSFFDKMDLIKEFLKGQSGLPITLIFKNNELIEIQFSS